MVKRAGNKINKLLGCLDTLAAFLLEPLLFAFILLLIFAHIQGIIDYILKLPAHNVLQNLIIFIQLLNNDMENNKMLWIGFLIIFSLLMFAKALQYRQQIHENRELVDSIKTLTLSMNRNFKVLRDDMKVLKDNIKGKRKK